MNSTKTNSTLPEYFGPASFHNGDSTLFYNNIKGNVAKRIATYKASHWRQVWLDRLIDLLADERLAPEVRAACGLCLHDWIHPFLDGNGHTGRLIMVAVLERRYSQPTVACLARELVVNRSTTMRLFRRLRNRESDVTDFCAGLLGQLRNAQEYALSMLDSA